MFFLGALSRVETSALKCALDKIYTRAHIGFFFFSTTPRSPFKVSAQGRWAKWETADTIRAHLRTGHNQFFGQPFGKCDRPFCSGRKVGRGILHTQKIHLAVRIQFLYLTFGRTSAIMIEQGAVSTNPSAIETTRCYKLITC